MVQARPRGHKTDGNDRLGLGTRDRHPPLRPRRLRPVLLVAALALLPACYRPQVVAGPKAPSALARVPGTGWSAVDGLRLHVFNTGANRVSPLLVGSPAPWRPVPAFAIEHPRRGLIVFDCGLGPEIARARERALHPITRLFFKSRSLPGRGLADQMREAGFAPEEVTTVIFSHLHFDHVGAANAFQNATFVVGRGERANATSRMNGFEPSHTDWISQTAWREIDFSRGKPYATFERGTDLFGDGSIVLVQGGGHTPGGLGAIVHLPRGPVLLAGDLVVHFDWLWSDDVQRIVSDAARAADVRNRVRALERLAPQAVILPGHDLSRVPRGRSDVVLHHPSWFSPQAWPVD